MEPRLPAQGLPLSQQEETNPDVESRGKKAPPQPTCRILHSAPGSITWPQRNPAPPPFPIVSITETAHERFQLNYSFQASPSSKLQWARRAIFSPARADRVLYSASESEFYWPIVISSLGNDKPFKCYYSKSRNQSIRHMHL